MSLVQRTESISIKSEGTRVLVNAIKTLWSSAIPATPSTPDDEGLSQQKQKQKQAIRLLLTQDCATALALLVARSGKYPLLVNEGIVALSLMSTQRAGGKCILYCSSRRGRSNIYL